METLAASYKWWHLKCCSLWKSCTHAVCTSQKSTAHMEKWRNYLMFATDTINVPTCWGKTNLLTCEWTNCAVNFGPDWSVWADKLQIQLVHEHPLKLAINTWSAVYTALVHHLRLILIQSCSQHKATGAPAERSRWTPRPGWSVSGSDYLDHSTMGRMHSAWLPSRSSSLMLLLTLALALAV